MLKDIYEHMGPAKQELKILGVERMRVKERMVELRKLKEEAAKR